MILDYLGGATVIPRVLLRVKLEGQKAKSEEEVRVVMSAQDHEHRMRSSSPKLEKGKETCCSLELPERTQPFRSLLCF